MKRLSAKIANKLFFYFQTVYSRLLSKRKLKILFSQKQAWKKAITKGFRFTPHEIAFEKLSPENIRDFDLVVPLTIGDLKYLNGVRDLIIDNPIPIPRMEAIVLCNGKYLLNQALIANGFGNLVPRMSGARTYPYILKKRIDEWGENSHIISGAQQEQNLSEVLTDPEYFCQEFIPGRHQYAAHILFKDQRIVCSINIEHVFRTGIVIQGQDESIYSKICHCPYLDQFSSILSSIGFDGLCCIDYKDFDNRPHIFEINPRFGGSLCQFFFSFMRYIE